MTNQITFTSEALTRPGRYLIITAMRNEILTIETTIKSVLSQTMPPKLWIILDDGSTDNSSEVVDHYVSQYPWIHRISIPDRGFDFVGKGVADLLNFGFEQVGNIQIEFVSKLDADLSFSEDYYEKLIAKMDQEPNLGIISGHPYIIKKGKKVFERHSEYFPSGTARLYRFSYLKEIGPFVSSVGWDTVDILRMRMLNYNTRVLSDLPIHHIRRMGTRLGYFDGMTRDGRNNYITGYSTTFFVFRAIYNGKYYPFFIRTYCMLYGYICAHINKLPLAVTPQEHLFHVNLQRKRLGLKKLNKL